MKAVFKNLLILAVMGFFSLSHAQTKNLNNNKSTPIGYTETEFTRLTEHYVVVNCKAFTERKDGRRQGHWTAGRCGAVVEFISRDGPKIIDTTYRYVSCQLEKSNNENSCSVNLSYGDLRIPLNYFATTNNTKGVKVPELPNKYPNVGAWFGYAKDPLTSVRGSGNPIPGEQILTIDIEHHLVAYF